MATKTVKEITTDVGGNVSVEYSDDSTSSFNIANTVTASTNLTGVIELIASGVVINTSSGVMNPYSGNCASRCRTYGNIMAATKYANTHLNIVAKDTLKAPVVLASALYSAFDLTLTFSLEYQGVSTPVTFGGQPSVLVPAGTFIESDAVLLPTPIPAGATFRYNEYLISSGTSFPYAIVGGLNTSSGSIVGKGDAFEYSNTLITDKTMIGGWVNTTAKFNRFPLGIIDKTSKPSFLLLGDSRLQNAAPGVPDFVSDQSGQLGYFERSLGQSHGVINTGVNGAYLSNAMAGVSLKLLDLQKYVSHVVSDYGVNDIIGGSGLAATKTNMASLIALLPGKGVYWTTAEPWATSTDGFATVTNQTPHANSSILAQWNAYLRAGAPGVDGMIDIASDLEYKSSGKWAVSTEVPAIVTASVSSSTLTVSAVASGVMELGQAVFRAGGATPVGVYISAFGTGTGGVGTYTLSAWAGTIASEGFVCNKPLTGDGYHAMQAGNMLAAKNPSFSQLSL